MQWLVGWSASAAAPPVVLAYADNGSFLGAERRAVQSCKECAASELRARTFPVHEELDASTVGTMYVHDCARACFHLSFGGTHSYELMFYM